MGVDIEALLTKKSKLIDAELAAVFPKKGIANLNDAIWYTLPGGKRIRPILAIMTCEALGGNSKQVLPFAAACEILHNWMLVHDDIEDSDKMRRDKPTVWVKYGVPHGINIGDYMSEKVYELILRSSKYGVNDKVICRLIEAMLNAAIKTSEGQAMDMNLRENNNPTEKDYMKTVIGKTAYYFTVPMIGGAIIAGAGKKILDKIIEFGRHAGPAFQITDDLLDLTEGKGRGEIGRDIKEGKRSILVVHCLSRCDSDEKASLLNILNKNPEDTSSEDVAFVKSLFEKYGSIDYAGDKAKRLIKEAKNAIKGLPAELRENLAFMADYLIERKK